MLRYYFEKYADVQIVAYTVDKAYLESDTYDGLPAVAYEEVEKAYPPTEYTMVIALGYKKMNQIRQQKFEDALHWRMEQRLEIPTLYGTEARFHMNRRLEIIISFQWILLSQEKQL